jgi:hypothetical protein
LTSLSLPKGAYSPRNPAAQVPLGTERRARASFSLILACQRSGTLGRVLEDQAEKGETRRDDRSSAALAAGTP